MNAGHDINRTDPAGDVEQRVRAAFAASETVTRGWDMGPLDALGASASASRRPRRSPYRRWAAPLSAAAAVAVVVATTAVLGGHGGSGRSPLAALSSTEARSTPASGAPPSISGSPRAPSTAGSSTGPLVGGPDHSGDLGPVNPRIGVSYPFSLLTHCGIRATTFGGRQWTAVHPQPEPARHPDRYGVTHYTGYVAGTATLLSSTALRFSVTDPESAARGQSYLFTPATHQVPLCA